VPTFVLGACQSFVRHDAVGCRDAARRLKSRAGQTKSAGADWPNRRRLVSLGKPAVSTAGRSGGLSLHVYADAFLPLLEAGAAS